MINKRGQVISIPDTLSRGIELEPNNQNIVEDLEIKTIYSFSQKAIDDIANATEAYPDLKILVRYIQMGFPESSKELPDTLKHYIYTTLQ